MKTPLARLLTKAREKMHPAPSLRELAKANLFPAMNLSRWESGHGRPLLLQLPAIAIAYMLTYESVRNAWLKSLLTEAKSNAKHGSGAASSCHARTGKARLPAGGKGATGKGRLTR